MDYRITIQNKMKFSVIYESKEGKKKIEFKIPHESDLDQIFKYIGESIMYHEGKKENVEFPRPKVD